jgi:hypothetical protein
MNTKFIVILCFFLVSCELDIQNNTNTDLVTVNKLTKDEHTTLYKKNKKNVHHDFANFPFGFPLGIEDMDKLFTDFDSLKVKITPIENKYDDELVDTLYYFSSQKKQFLFYKSTQATFLNSAMIMDSSVILNRGIHIGISKSVFLEKLNLDSTKTDTLQIVGDEEYAEHTFYFEKNSLSRIEIYHNVE